MSRSSSSAAPGGADLLLGCRRTFEEANDVGKPRQDALGALARVEDRRCRGEAAIRLELDALRYSYLAGNVTSIAASYHSLGNWLAIHARQPIPALANHLAAAVVYSLIGYWGFPHHSGLRGDRPARLRRCHRRADNRCGPVPPGRRHPRHGPARPDRQALPDPRTAEAALCDLIARVQAPAPARPGLPRRLLVRTVKQTRRAMAQLRRNHGVLRSLFRKW